MDYDIDHVELAEPAGGRALRDYSPKVREHTCPACGECRPADWYISRDQRCWKCRELGRSCNE